ncbi:hypothetical protein MUCCIDRAFT_115367 [Mucor lusitanicus CBS 277.49]|uniref:DDE Tnp4 domain-containing protein n=1 Tax=Mucor lusitanicus CBS 277.49 TaxID=747725 RepID=A0A162YFH1_MUCCL|nr:hypothetical protein MUCCIDRAFT_115367 [Mucor lusitanicus CBS 277.49]
MPKTSLRQSVIKQLRQRADNNCRDAENLIKLLTEFNKISEIDERNKNIHDKLQDLEQQQRYLMPTRTHYKRRDKPHDAALEDKYFQKSEVDFRRYIQMNGSVRNYVEHFIEAVLKLQDRYIQWPMGKERDHRRLFQIYQTPSGNSENMVICDFDTRILFGTTGHYGSQNDPGVLSQSGLLELFGSYFESEQYVVAD